MIHHVVCAFGQVPREVDYRVMLTFSQFYETLLGFVLFKLYTELGLHYPPQLQSVKGKPAV